MSAWTSMDTVGDARSTRDELAGGTTPSRHTRALVALVLVLLAVAFVADRWQVQRERSALVASVADGEQVVTASENSLLSLVAYAGPLLSGADVPAATRRSALQTLGRDAGRWEPRLRREQTRVRGQRVVPWHRDVAAARDAYAERLETWADELAYMQSEPQRLLDGGHDVRRARLRAVQALLDAGVAPARVRELLGSGEAATLGQR